MKEFVTDFSVRHICGVLIEELPWLEIRTIQPITTGWDNMIFDVNDEWIFKFPRRPLGDKDIEEEMNILNAVRSNITLPIPNIEILGKNHYFWGYKRLNGVTLSEEQMRALPIPTKERIGRQCGRFLYEFHNAISIEHGRQLGYTDMNLSTYCNGLIEKLKEAIPQELNLIEFAERSVDQFQIDLQIPDTQVLMYNDLHNQNILYDPVKQQLSGMIDLGDISIGPLSFEFHFLYRISESYLQFALEEYERLSGIQFDLSRMITQSIVGTFWDIAYTGSAEADEVTIFAMKRLRQWMNPKKAST